MGEWLQRNVVSTLFVRMIALLGAAFCLLVPACLADEIRFRLSFGSCMNQERDAPILTQVRKRNSDIFLMLGDNIYSTNEDMDAMKQAYDKLVSRALFSNLRRLMPVFAVWDDNDYGAKDGGAEFPLKEQSKELLLDAFSIPEIDPVRSHPGVYQSYLFGSEGGRVQLLLLDTRWFRSPLAREQRPKVGHGPYAPTTVPTATILGAEQWRWLQKELLRSAEVRLIASSIQVLSADHGYESWGNFPAEQLRLIQLLRKTRAEAVVFLSGDRHHGELSRFSPPALYPLYDLTSSSLNMEREPGVEENRLRIGERYLGSNVGEVEVSFSGTEPVIALRILSVTGEVVLQHLITRSELEFSD